MLGRNGAGKTTLFNCVNGDIKHDSGRFYLETDTDIRDVVPEDIGYVLSTPTVPEFLTGRELLKFFMDIHEDTIRDPKMADEYFDDMGIERADRDKLLKDYSYAICKVLAGFALCSFSIGRWMGLSVLQCLLIPLFIAGVKHILFVT